MEYKDITTKTGQLEFIQNKLANDPRWLMRGLITIYNNQTADEQRAESTEKHNGIGFKVQDAKYLTSVLHQALNKGLAEGLRNTEVPFNPRLYISEKQWPHVYKRMQKYARQLHRMAQEKEELRKLKNQQS